MPVKILLADKSITIQKVVEMLFSGRDYEVVCVSDGETALNEAKRVVPDVVLVDVDLPRIDGYSFATRLKQTPQLAQAPVILMMSRDDVYDGAKGKQAGIIDNIAKPFESQELIGKVKKAIAAAPPRRAEAALLGRVRACRTRTAGGTGQTNKKRRHRISLILSARPLLRRTSCEQPHRLRRRLYTKLSLSWKRLKSRSPATWQNRCRSAPRPWKRCGLGLGLTAEKKEPQPEIITIESLDKAMAAELPAAFTPKTPGPSPQRPIPSSVQVSTLPEAELRKMAETTIAKMARDVFANLPPVQPPQISDATLRAMIEEKVSSMTKEAFDKMPVPQTPTLSASEIWGIAEETVAKMAREVFRFPASRRRSRYALRAMVEEVASMTQTLSQCPSRTRSLRERYVGVSKSRPKIARMFCKLLGPAPQISDATLRAMIEEKVSSMTKEALEKAPAAQPSALSPSDMWSVAEEAVEKIAKEFLQRQPLTQGPQLSDETLRGMVEKVAVKTVEEILEKRPVQQPPSMPAGELRMMAEETVSRMAREVFKDMPPPVPKISEETVRRGIEEAVLQIAREVAREVIEKVAWEVIPQLAEVMIKEEIERLKAEA